MLPPKNAAAAIVESAAALALSLPAPTHFANLGFIDSMGLGVIVRAQSRLRGVEPARQVVVRHANAHARKVFEITGLDRILRLEP